MPEINRYQPALKLDDVVVFKIGQDEIVGKFVDENDDVIFVDQPLSVMIQRGQDGQPAIGLRPWFVLIAEPKRVAIRKIHLLSDPLSSSKELFDAWTRETSGLILGR